MENNNTFECIASLQDNETFELAYLERIEKKGFEKHFALQEEVKEEIVPARLFLNQLDFSVPRLKL